MKSDEDFLVTLTHMHSVPAWGGRVGYCNKGGRKLAERYGLDWSAIVRDGGISASQLLATGDALALNLVTFAREEVRNGR